MKWSNQSRDLIQEAKKEQKKQTIDLYLQCKQQNEISQEIDLSESQISRILQKFKDEEMQEINLVPDSLQLYFGQDYNQRFNKVRIVLFSMDTLSISLVKNLI